MGPPPAPLGHPSARGVHEKAEFRHAPCRVSRPWKPVRLARGPAGKRVSNWQWCHSRQWSAGIRRGAAATGRACDRIDGCNGWPWVGVGGVSKRAGRAPVSTCRSERARGRGYAGRTGGGRGARGVSWRAGREREKERKGWAGERERAQVRKRRNRPSCSSAGAQCRPLSPAVNAARNATDLSPSMLQDAFSSSPSCASSSRASSSQSC